MVLVSVSSKKYPREQVYVVVSPGHCPLTVFEEFDSFDGTGHWAEMLNLTINIILRHVYLPLSS